MVYFFFPETTSRSLEEMDRIFHKSQSIFDVVGIARNEPHMYGPNGELLRTLDDVEDEAVRRAAAITHSKNKNNNSAQVAHNENTEKLDDSNSS